jgi:hypothetical protein
MDEEIEKRLREAVRTQQLERLERMSDPRLEKWKKDPELQESLQRWRNAISTERARWARDNPGILDDEEMINGPDSPRDLDHPFDGIPEEFLPEAMLEERRRREELNLRLFNSQGSPPDPDSPLDGTPKQFPPKGPKPFSRDPWQGRSCSGGPV